VDISGLGIDVSNTHQLRKIAKRKLNHLIRCNAVQSQSLTIEGICTSTNLLEVYYGMHHDRNRILGSGLGKTK